MQMPKRDEFPERPKRIRLPEIEYYIFRRRPLRLIKVPLLVWGKWFGDRKHFLHETELGNGVVKVSTICLGFDHSLGFTPGRLELFETAVGYFGGFDVCGRCGTFEEAEKLHNHVVAEVLREHGGFLAKPKTLLTKQ